MKYLIIPLVLILLSGCTTLVATTDPVQDNEQTAPLLVTNVSDPITFSITNPKNKEATFGVPFSLSMFEDNHWKPIPMKEEMAFILIAYILKPNESVQETIDLSFYYDGLKDGLYRITKLLYYDDETIEYHIEFQIKTS
jgi:uncharacterized protein YceK